MCGDVHHGGSAHGDSGDSALAVGADPVSEDGCEFLGVEGLPLVVLAIVRLFPVGVKGALAANRQDDDGVLVRIELLDIRLDSPAALLFHGAQPAKVPTPRESPGRCHSTGRAVAATLRAVAPASPRTG